jgi:hypothetical protein
MTPMSRSLSRGKRGETQRGKWLYLVVPRPGASFPSPSPSLSRPLDLLSMSASVFRERSYTGVYCLDEIESYSLELSLTIALCALRGA